MAEELVVQRHPCISFRVKARKHPIESNIAASSGEMVVEICSVDILAVGILHASKDQSMKLNPGKHLDGRIYDQRISPKTSGQRKGKFVRIRAL